jgi:hypothetical protein
MRRLRSVAGVAPVDSSWIESTPISGMSNATS